MKDNVLVNPRQAEAIKGVLIDKKSVRKAMLDAGYAIDSADNASIKKTKAWQKAMEEYGVSIEHTQKRHGELLRSKNEQVALKAVDISYKVHGEYDTQKSANTFNAPVLIQITPPNDPQLNEITAQPSDIKG